MPFMIPIFRCNTVEKSIPYRFLLLKFKGSLWSYTDIS